MRDIHRLAAESLVVVVILHLARTFLTGPSKKPRRFTWATGVVLLIAVLFLSFSGYLLPWDQLAYWAVTIGTSLADAQGSYRFSGTNVVTVTGPDGSTLATSVPVGWSAGLRGWDGQPDFVGPSGWIAEMRYVSSQSVAYARPADFLAGAPGETIGLALKGDRMISFNASGPYNAKLSGGSGGVVCATYAYTPPCRDPVRPLVAIAAVAGTSDVRLTGTDDPVNEGYEVHCSIEPSFAAGQSTLQVRYRRA